MTHLNGVFNSLKIGSIGSFRRAGAEFTILRTPKTRSGTRMIHGTSSSTLRTTSIQSPGEQVNTLVSAHGRALVVGVRM